MIQTFIITGSGPQYFTDKLNSKLHELNIDRARLIEIKFIQEQHNHYFVALVIYSENIPLKIQHEIKAEKSKS